MYNRVAQKIISYRTLSISLLNIDQFSQFIFSPVDSAGNLLLTGVHTTPTVLLHYLVKHKCPKRSHIRHKRAHKGRQLEVSLPSPRAVTS